MKVLMPRPPFIPLLLGALLVAGCTGNSRKAERPATSLVYSPTAGMAQRDEQQAAAKPENPQPPSGRACRLHFRRDAMGIAAPLTGNNVAADRVAVNGVIDFVSEDWLVFRSDGSIYWVPRDAVLAVEFTTGR